MSCVLVFIDNFAPTSGSFECFENCAFMFVAFPSHFAIWARACCVRGVFRVCFPASCSVFRTRFEFRGALHVRFKGGRRFANFQRLRGPAGPRESGFCDVPAHVEFSFSSTRHSFDVLTVLMRARHRVLSFTTWNISTGSSRLFSTVALSWLWPCL